MPTAQEYAQDLYDAMEATAAAEQAVADVRALIQPALAEPVADGWRDTAAGVAIIQELIDNSLKPVLQNYDAARVDEKAKRQALLNAALAAVTP